MNGKPGGGGEWLPAPGSKSETATKRPRSRLLQNSNPDPESSPPTLSHVPCVPHTHTNARAPHGSRYLNMETLGGGGSCKASVQIPLLALLCDAGHINSLCFPPPLQSGDETLSRGSGVKENNMHTERVPLASASPANHAPLRSQLEFCGREYLASVRKRDAGDLTAPRPTLDDAGTVFSFPGSTSTKRPCSFNVRVPCGTECPAISVQCRLRLNSRTGETRTQHS